VNEFKGTQGEWEYVFDIDYDQGGNAIGLGAVVEVGSEVIIKGITRDGTTDGCNVEDIQLAAASPALFKAVNDFLNHFEGDIPLWLFEEAEAAVAKALGK